MVTRMLETSCLVLEPFKNPQAGSFFASCVAIVGLSAQQKLGSPWLNYSNNRVAEAGQWLVFIWLFSMQPHDLLRPLSGRTRRWLWGMPLTALVVAFIAFAVKLAYEDFVAHTRFRRANRPAHGRASARHDTASTASVQERMSTRETERCIIINRKKPRHRQPTRKTSVALGEYLPSAECFAPGVVRNPTALRDTATDGGLKIQMAVVGNGARIVLGDCRSSVGEFEAEVLPELTRMATCGGEMLNAAHGPPCPTLGPDVERPRFSTRGLEERLPSWQGARLNKCR
jgi:hypothetical protein